MTAETTHQGGLRMHHLDKRDLFYYPDPTVAFLCVPYLVRSQRRLS